MDTDTRKILRALNRLAFGPAPGDLEQVKAAGLKAYIHTQLHPHTGRLPGELQTRLDALDTLRLSPAQLFEQYRPPRPAPGQKRDPAAVKAARQRARVLLVQATQARLLRAIASPWQLHEVMVNFWYNHFNVFAGKGLCHLWIGTYEEEAIRPHALGRFRDLLLATARHPAMLFYLDNWLSSAPGSPGARGRFSGINENYAREVMELHTLGVNGGYTQKDVDTLAYILTGWTLRPGRGFYFDARRHDFSTKTLLGVTLPGNGENEGIQALEMLARHPATARHIAYQLTQYFVADQPPPVLVERLARRYQETDGNIQETLAALFQSAEFWSPELRGNKFKTPYAYVVSTVRASGLPVINTRPLQGALYQLGMPLYGCLPPDGYKNTQDAWLTPDAMMRRLSFATALASGRLPLDRALPEQPVNMRATFKMRPRPGQPHPVDSVRLAATLGDSFPAHTQRAVVAAPPALRAAVMLGSPQCMYS